MWQCATYTPKPIQFHWMEVRSNNKFGCLTVFRSACSHKVFFKYRCFVLDAICLYEWLFAASCTSPPISTFSRLNITRFYVCFLRIVLFLQKPRIEQGSRNHRQKARQQCWYILRMIIFISAGKRSDSLYGHTVFSFRFCWFGLYTHLHTIEHTLS